MRCFKQPTQSHLSAAIHHPDKVTSIEDSLVAESYFVNLKTAQDTLIDPVRRFAYERFGPDMLRWQHCITIRDYILVGLQTAAPLYFGSIIFLIILGVSGYLQWGRFVCTPLSNFFSASFAQPADSGSICSGVTLHLLLSFSLSITP